jgi:hypothetical protein
MADWQAALEQAVRERWDNHQVFFVAQVKPFLARQGFDVEEIVAGRQVRHFIEKELPSVQQIQNEREPTNWGLVPADAEFEPPAAQYFQSQARRGPRHDYPYQNALRTALTRPLAENCARWLLFNPPRFTDLPNGSTQPEGVELPRRLINPDASNEQLSRTTERFLADAGLDPADFKAGQPRSVSQPQRERSALHHLLTVLREEDLNRISMPLDIVRHLLDQDNGPPR